jgi:hypothetical protein
MPCGEDRTTDIAEVLLERGLARVEEDHLPSDCEHYRDLERRSREQHWIVGRNGLTNLRACV